MMISMVSLAGLPFTGGFLGKFFVFVEAFSQRQYALVIIGLVSVGCGFYYYLKVVKAMYFQPVADEVAASALGRITISTASRCTIALLVAAIVILGVYPSPVLGLLGKARRTRVPSMMEMP